MSFLTDLEVTEEMLKLHIQQRAERAAAISKYLEAVKGKESPEELERLARQVEAAGSACVAQDA